MRVEEYAQLEKHQEELKQVQEQLNAGIDRFSEMLELKKEVAEGEEVDGRYQRAIALIREQKGIAEGMGEQMIGAKVSEEMVHLFFDLLQDDGGALEPLLKQLDQKIATFERQIQLEESKIDRPTRGKVIEQLMNEQGSYINLRTKIVVGLADMNKLHKQEIGIYGSAT